MFDILIKNGVVIDGTGKEKFEADVGINDNKIEVISDLGNEEGEKEIDARGQYVCPGFIDVNNHSDTYWRIFLNPNLESLVYQGITTIVGGNCGSSLAPLPNAATIASIRKWIDVKTININWLKLREFFEVLEKKPLSVNFATLVGHAVLRRGFLGDEVRNPDSKEMKSIKKMLKDALSEGALGMSTGLIYTHAKLASTEELVDLAKIVKKYNGVYATHIRGEEEEFIPAVEEALTIARKSGVKLHISHLKVMGEKNWPKMDEALKLIEKAQKEGIKVTFDVYPYTNTGSVLYVLLPDWVSEGGRAIMLKRLKDPSVKAKVIEEMKNSGFDYSKVEIAISPLNKTLARKKVTEIAQAQGKSIEETVIDILVASEGQVITSMEVLSEENVKKAIVNPLSLIASNGSGYDLKHAQTGERVHPRSFGAFPRVLSKYVLKEEVLSWEEAIKKMTSFPAQKFGIKKRGILKKGYFADITIFDKNSIEDLSTSQDPYKYSRGINYVIVNGKVALHQGKYTEALDGKIIKM